MGNARNIAFWAVLLLLVFALFQMFNGSQATTTGRDLSYSEFITKVNDGEVASVVLDGERVVIKGNDGSTYVAIKPQGEEVAGQLITKGVDVTVKSQEQSGIFSLISLWLPFLVLNSGLK